MCVAQRAISSGMRTRAFLTYDDVRGSSAGETFNQNSPRAPYLHAKSFLLGGFMRSAKNCNSCLQLRQVRVPAPLVAEASVMNCKVVHELRASQSTTLAGVPAFAGQIPKKCLTRHPMHGFSMLELLAAVSIIAVMAAMALPTLLSTMHYRTLQNTLLSSAGGIQKARFQAVTTGVPWEIIFNHTTSTYQVEACSNCLATIYDPNSSYSYLAKDLSGNSIPAVPFTSTGGATLAADQTMYFRPGGAVQSTWGTTNCATPISMTFTYLSVSKTMTVGCYGNVTVPQ